MNLSRKNPLVLLAVFCFLFNAFGCAPSAYRAHPELEFRSLASFRLRRLFLLLSKVAFCILFAFLLTGYPGQVIADENIQQKWLPFIKDGKTTKEEVLLKLGMPSAQFEGERILIYKMMFDEKEGFKVASRYISMAWDSRFSQWGIPEYHLVLVFDKRNVLQRHSLLFIKPS